MGFENTPPNPAPSPNLRIFAPVNLTLPARQQTHRTVLPNGIVVLATENPAADIISTRMFLRAGSRLNPIVKAGLANLAAAVMTKGTVNYSSLEIAEQVESVGASLSTDSAADYFLVSCKTVSADFAPILKLTTEVLRFPTFPEVEVELERKLTLQGIRSRQEQPMTVATDHLRRAMYGDHPYALPGSGTAETVTALTRANLVAFHSTYFRPDNLIISLVGRIDPAQALDQIQAVLGDWVPPAAAMPRLELAPIGNAPTRIITPQDTQQSIVKLGYLAPAVPQPVADADPLSDLAALDYAALKLLNTYLGNGLSSRLFVELREKRGLAYEVSAYFPTRLDASQFVVYMGTAPANTQTAFDGLKSEVDRLVAAPLSAEELQTAKNKLLGQYALGKQTNSQIAQTFGWYEILGLGVAFDQQFPAAMAAVTPELAQAAAVRCFGEPYVSVLGPEDAVRPLQA
jgi:zinc protease